MLPGPDSAALLGRRLARRTRALALVRRGRRLGEQGQAEQAVAAYTASINLDPDLLDAHRCRATALSALGRHEEAAKGWEHLCRRVPDDVEPTLHRVHALSMAGRTEAALACATTALQARPDEPRLLTLTGMVLLRLGAAEQAIGALLLALERKGDNPQALTALGIAFLRTDDPNRAFLYAHAAYQLAPDYETTVNLSRVLLELGAFEEARHLAEQAIACQPAGWEARNNHAIALEALRRFEDASDAWRRTIEACPDMLDGWHNLAALRLLMGEVTPASWAIYERRLHPDRFGGARRWRGEPIAGKTILLHFEGGLGDTIQFARYCPLVAARGPARVILAVQPSLVRLLAHTPGADLVIGGDQPASLVDVICPLMSLPLMMGTTLENIPPPLTLTVPPAPRTGPGLRVGLVWSGNPTFANDGKRSIAPGMLATLLGVPGVDFHSLQFGLSALPPELPIGDLMAGVQDFADTAERMAGLDLVIAVDTSTAHLAACMGKPVWLLSRYLGCWRWLLDRADSPWYPTLRIYRQPSANAWVPVLDQVRQDLTALTAVPVLRAA